MRISFGRHDASLQRKQFDRHAEATESGQRIPKPNRMPTIRKEAAWESGNSQAGFPLGIIILERIKYPVLQVGLCLILFQKEAVACIGM